jgi:hypothetical protein
VTEVEAVQVEQVEAKEDDRQLCVHASRVHVTREVDTGLPVVIADEPLTCVARGGGRVLELLDEYGPSAFSVE